MIQINGILHNDKHLSILVAYSSDLKGTYENIKSYCILPQSNSYVIDLQGGLTKYCFLCMWETRATDKHHLIKD